MGQVGSKPQSLALLDAAREFRLNAYVVLSLTVGIRTEEARELRGDHVDLDGDPKAVPPVPPSVAVWWSVRQGGDTKTAKSRRTLALPRAPVQALREHRTRQAEDRLAAGAVWQDHELVFASALGTPLDAVNVRREFRKITESAGLGAGWAPRDLRHTFVSLMSADGVPTSIPEATPPARRSDACHRTVVNHNTAQGYLNAHAERFVLTARTEVTDRMLIFGERLLRSVLAEYAGHYSGRRPHRSRQLQPPLSDHPAADPSQERIRCRPVLGSLLNEYEEPRKSSGQDHGRVLEPRRARPRGAA